MEHQIAQKMEVDLSKFPMGLVFDTPNFEDILKIKEEYQNAQDLLNKLSIVCQSKGFRVYRHYERLYVYKTGHSLGSKHAESRLLIMCSAYSTSRCPFILTYKRPEIPHATFVLLKYRSEHNHPLSHRDEAC